MEAGAWQQRARYNENMINALKFNIQQVHAQSRDSREGCGDSEVDDTASCYNDHAIDFHLLCKDNNDMKELMICKVCRVNEVCMLLLPCCLCIRENMHQLEATSRELKISSRSGFTFIVELKILK
nr:probable BOI-related E3 ubiquitin-protein ligase 3 [Populus alba]